MVCNLLLVCFGKLFDDNCAVSASILLKEVAKSYIYLISKFIDATYLV